MLSRGASAFDEVYYLGHEPLDASGKRVDVLISKLSTAQSRWYFDLETGALVGFDLRLADNADECEVRVAEWQATDGRKLPSQISVRSGDHDFATIKFNKIEFKPPRSKDEAKKPAGAGK
jgi:hypothetical protein